MMASDAGGCLGCLFFGLCFIFTGPAPRLIFAVLYNVVLLRHRSIVEWLKVRLTYPRTG
jgi:hypothetical protein